MAEHEKELHFAILNIVATPHPPGTYERLIREAARKSVNFWGDQYAQIGDAEEIEPGLLWGRLVVSFQEVVHSDRTGETGVTRLQHSPEGPNEHPQECPFDAAASRGDGSVGH
jgi:hypothetical protein